MTSQMLSLSRTGTSTMPMTVSCTVHRAAAMTRCMLSRKFSENDRSTVGPCRARVRVVARKGERGAGRVSHAALDQAARGAFAHRSLRARPVKWRPLPTSRRCRCRCRYRCPARTGRTSGPWLGRSRQQRGDGPPHAATRTRVRVAAPLQPRMQVRCAAAGRPPAPPTVTGTPFVAGLRAVVCAAGVPCCGVCGRRSWGGRGCGRGWPRRTPQRTPRRSTAHPTAHTRHVRVRCSGCRE